VPDDSRLRVLHALLLDLLNTERAHLVVALNANTEAREALEQYGKRALWEVLNGDEP
jgi:hypothetical protein